MSQDARFDEEQATARRARVLGFNYVDTSQLLNKILYKEILPVDQLKGLRVIPLQADKNNIQFGITTTTSQQTIQMIQTNFQDQRITFAIISDTGYRDYIKLFDPPPEVIYQEIKINQTGDDLINEVSGILNQVKADDMLAYLVEQAHRLNASDIHIETRKENTDIRYRIDGVLHPIAKINYDKYRVLISAIASAANISTSSDDAQQGHIAHKVVMADGHEVDVNVRVETVQTINSMDVVMRLFNMDQSSYTLDRLGLSTEERKNVDNIIAQPNGLVMVVGPTGSGKTTTLYSMLNSLNSSERKIITIEDPVEYQFNGITQIPVNTKSGAEDFRFADKLLAILRLDPDIVMVGEIRDMDTAKTALQAALTGHLVLSTFHASSAAAAITRLADVIDQNPLYISSIRLIMAQRLVRKLDADLKVEYDPSEAEVNKLAEIINTLPTTIEKPNLVGIKLFKAGKSQDNPYGYKGQIAIREQFIMTDKIRTILEDPNNIVTTENIEQAAIDSGMRTMIQDAALKVINGETTTEEMFRVLG
jgi:type II secretory ATPase GspE/PulE/Tfp pilus assembly ATPase PilB-like protein